MLDAIRKRSASFLVKLLFLLLVLSFGLWGIGDVISPNPRDEWAAKVGDVVVPNQILRDEYQNELRRLRQVLGDNIDRQQADALGLPGRSLEQIVNRTLLDLGADDLGVVASDNILRQTVQTNPAFENSRGVFDKQMFDQLVGNIGLTEAGYLATVSGDIVRGQLVRSVLAGAAPPRLLVDEVYRYRYEKRVVTYVRIENKTMTQLPNPEESELLIFYGDNTSLFVAPEYRSVTAIVLSPEDLTPEISIADEELETAFQDRAEVFSEPERRTLEQITFRTKDEGERAYIRVSNGIDFAIVAEEEAGLNADAIQLGTVTREQVLPELVDVAFKLPNGAVSELTKSPLGWHLIRVTSIQPAQQQSLEEVRDQLAEELADDKAVDALIELSNRLEDILGGGATLEEAVVQIDTKLLKIEAVSRQGLDSKGEQVSSLPSGFVETVFSTNMNSESALIEADEDGAYFVVRVDNVMPASPKPFELARDEAEAAWIASKRGAAAEATANAILLRIKQGVPLSDVAAENGLSVKTTSPIVRSGEGAAEGLETNLINSAFQSDPEQLFVVKGENASFVARVTNVTVADPASDPQRFAALSERLGNGGSNDLLLQLTAALTQRHPVEINDQVFNQLY